jgi:hypothetical protein
LLPDEGGASGSYAHDTLPGLRASAARTTVVDIAIQEPSPHDKPLNFLYGCGVGVIHREFLDLIGQEIFSEDLYLGRITNSRGEEIPDWVTFHGREVIIVRGSKNAEYRTCESCGRNAYYAAGKPYLYPAPPRTATIFQSAGSGLIVPRDVYERVATKKWRRVGIEELPILEAPNDGFGVLPYREPNYPKSSAP